MLPLISPSELILRPKGSPVAAKNPPSLLVPMTCARNLGSSPTELVRSAIGAMSNPTAGGGGGGVTTGGGGGGVTTGGVTTGSITKLPEPLLPAWLASPA